MAPKDLIAQAVQTIEEPTPIDGLLRGVTAPGRDSVPCVYCRGPIQSASFVYWSAAKRLVSAVCPTCGRGITVATVTWRRWNASSTSKQIDLRA